MSRTLAAEQRSPGEVTCELITVEYRNPRTNSVVRTKHFRCDAWTRFSFSDDCIASSKIKRSFGIELHDSRALKTNALFFPMTSGFKILARRIHEGKLTVQVTRRNANNVIMISGANEESLKEMLSGLKEFLSPGSNSKPTTVENRGRENQSNHRNKLKSKSYNRDKVSPRVPVYHRHARNGFKKNSDNTHNMKYQGTPKHSKTPRNALGDITPVDRATRRRSRNTPLKSHQKLSLLSPRARTAAAMGDERRKRRASDRTPLPTRTPGIRARRGGSPGKSSAQNYSQCRRILNPATPKAKYTNSRNTNDTAIPRYFTTANGGFQMSHDQQHIVEAVLSKSSVFFTGSAGSGKSLLLREITTLLPSSSTYITATTGVAACHISGTTLHHWAGLGRGCASAEELAKRVLKSPQAADRWRLTKNLIIDEISMLDAATFDILEKAARILRGIEKPFGGIKLILCGDFLQLPPVTTNKKQKALFCFEASSWGECFKNDNCYELRQVFRQRESSFSKILDQLRWGKCSKSAIAILKTRCSPNTLAGEAEREAANTDGILPTKLYTHQKDVYSINDRFLTKLPGAEHVFRARDKGRPSNPALKQLQRSCPAKDILKLRLGAQVMLVKSIAPQRGLVNGARGVVIRFTGLMKLPVVRFACDSRERLIGTEVWNVCCGSQVVASRTQLPLVLGWAISVHKSQGLTLDRAEVSLNKVFESGQAYVALSRVRSLEGLCIIGNFKPSCVKAHPRAVNFCKNLRRFCDIEDKTEYEDDELSEDSRIESKKKSSEASLSEAGVDKNINHVVEELEKSFHNLSFCVTPAKKTSCTFSVLSCKTHASIRSSIQNKPKKVNRNLTINNSSESSDDDFGIDDAALNAILDEYELSQKD